MIPRPLRKAVEEGAAGVYYLHGDDEVGKDEAARFLSEGFSDPATRDFNLDRLRGGEVDVETLASVLGTPPMMAEHRVVVVREVQAFAGTPRARTLLLEAVKSPPPGLVLILVASEPPGSTARFYADLRKGALAVEFRPPSEHDLPEWIRVWARETHGVEVEEEAARALAQAVGVHVPALAREIEKFSTLVGEGGVVDRGVVESAGIRIPRQDRWQWLDLVGGRRFDEALRGLPILLEQGESGVRLTMSLATHLLRLGVVLDAGPAALAPALPPNQRYLANRYGGQARGWSVEEVEDALAGLLEVDRALKSSPMPEEHFLERWLLERMLGTGAPA